MAQSTFRVKRQFKKIGTAPADPLAMTGSTTLAGGTVNSSYIVPVTATGGTAPYTFTAVNSLPGGLSVASSGSVLGTPSTNAVSTFTIQVTDNVGSTASQQYKITVNSSGSGTAHDYFNQLSALPECLSSATFSLRDQTQLNTLARSSPSTWYTYQFGSDPYATPQDAAKLTWARSFVSIGNQLDIDVNQFDGSLLFIWDHWIGPEWRRSSNGGQMSSRTAVNLNHKSFHVHTISSTGGQSQLSFETNTTWNSTIASTGVAIAGLRNYGVSPGDPPPVTNDQPFTPGGAGSTQAYMTRPSMWNRHIIQLDLNVDASTAFDEWNAAYSTVVPSSVLWHRLSYWFMDEQRTPMRLAYRAPAHREKPLGTTNTKDGIAFFNLEHNTSSDHPTSSGAIRFTGIDGSVIPAGFVVKRTSDSRAYQTIVSSTIASGVAVVRAQNASDFGGEQANMSTGTAMTLSTLIIGVDSTASAESGFQNGIYFIAVDPVMYTRNVIVLKNYTSVDFASATPENDTVIFQLPVA